MGYYSTVYMDDIKSDLSPGEINALYAELMEAFAYKDEHKIIDVLGASEAIANIDLMHWCLDYHTFAGGKCDDGMYKISLSEEEDNYGKHYSPHITAMFLSTVCVGGGEKGYMIVYEADGSFLEYRIYPGRVVSVKHVTDCTEVVLTNMRLSATGDVAE